MTRWLTVKLPVVMEAANSADDRPWLHSDACIFVAWDLETSGPDPLQHEIVQLAAVCANGSFSSLVRPRRGAVTPGAERVHGISDKVLAAESPFPAVFAAFVDFLVSTALASVAKEHSCPKGNDLLYFGLLIVQCFTRPLPYVKRRFLA